MGPRSQAEAEQVTTGSGSKEDQLGERTSHALVGEGAHSDGSHPHATCEEGHALGCTLEWAAVATDHAPPVTSSAPATRPSPVMEMET